MFIKQQPHSASCPGGVAAAAAGEQLPLRDPAAQGHHSRPYQRGTRTSPVLSGGPSGPPGPSLGPLTPGEALTRFQGHPQHQLAPVVEGEEAADQEALRFLVPLRKEPVAEVILLASPLFLLVRRRRGGLPLLHGRPRPLLLAAPAGHRPRRRDERKGRGKTNHQAGSPPCGEEGVWPGSAEGRGVKRGGPRTHALSALAVPAPAAAAAGLPGRGDRVPAESRGRAAFWEEAWPRAEGVRRRQKEAGPGAGESAAGRGPVGCGARWGAGGAHAEGPRL